MFYNKKNPLKAIKKINNLKINVITNNQNKILNFIDQISDENMKRRVIDACIKEEYSNSSEIINENYGIPQHKVYSLKEVFRRIETIGSSRPTNIKYLRVEVNEKNRDQKA